MSIVCVFCILYFILFYFIIIISISVSISISILLYSVYDLYNK